MKAVLKVAAGDGVGRSFTLRVAQVFVMGRGETSSIRFNDSAVSRNHCELILSANGELTITDLGSSNGTYLHGRRIASNRPARVLSGDTVVLGSSVLTVKIEGNDDDSSNRRRRALREDESVLPLDEFEILGALGEGSYGRVYSARQRLLDRVVAVKIMRDRVKKDDPVWERFLREGQLACRIESPYVVHVHTIRLAKDRIYLVMELVNGPSAKDKLSGGPLSLPDALGIACDVAQGLGVVHAAGILHRDVKPSNILLCPSGVAKLGDFGCAKDLNTDEALTDSNQGIGSLPYVSPEQASDARAVDERTDVYGLGATLYHFLAGRPPFLATSPEVFLRVVEKPPEWVGRLRPDLPQDLARLVHGMLEKDPDLRPPTAESVQRQLREIRALHCPEVDVPSFVKKPSHRETARLPKGFYQGASGSHSVIDDPDS